jgi:hypothetical protein
VDTVAAAQMGGENKMASGLSRIRRGLVVVKRVGGEVSAFKSEQHAYGIVALQCGEMERCVSTDHRVILVCAGLHWQPHDLNMTTPACDKKCVSIGRCFVLVCASIH